MKWRDVFTAFPATASSDKSLGSVEGFVRWLIQHAARNAPPSLSQRLEEEWLADLAARRGPMARLRFGFGCCWATGVITHEHCAVKIPAASSATGHKIMTAYVQHDSSFFSRRTTVFVLIICLHAVLIYALTTGLAHPMIEVIPPMQAAFPPDRPTGNMPTPLPPPPKFSPPRVEIPDSEIPLDVAPDPNRLQDVTFQPEEHPTQTPPKAVNRVLGGPGRGFPNTDDYYPSVARRIGEKGTATVQVCVDEKGRLTLDPTLTQSSGSASLDAGALKLAKAGSGHYRATTEDGRPVNSCYVFRIKFDLID